MLHSIDVLLVDDRMIDADVTMLAVRRAAPDIKMLWLKESDEALQFVFCVGVYRNRPRNMPRLIFLDLDMPFMSGLGVLDLLRSHPQTADVPVALLLDGPVPLSLRRGDAFDAHAYVTKPFDLEKYCQQIQRLLRQWLPHDRHFPHRQVAHREAIAHVAG